MGQKLGLLRFFAILLGGINDRTVDPVVAGSSPVALARRVPGSVRTGRLQVLWAWIHPPFVRLFF